MFPDGYSFHEVRADVDPFATIEVFELIEKGFGLMVNQADSATCAYQCNIMFEEHVTYEAEPYRQLSRLGATVSVAAQRPPGQSHWCG